MSFAAHFRSPGSAPADAPTAVRAGTYLGDHRVLVRTVWGHKLILDGRDLSLAPHLILDGYWEMWISRVFQALLKPGMTVVEVGPNVGYYTVLAAAQVGATGRVIAVEANPQMAKLLRDNLSINGQLDRTRIVEAAAYSEETELEFKCFRDHMGNSSLFADDNTAARFADQLDTLQVPAVTLDSVIASGQRVDLIKIDAEGAELHALRGAARILTENPDVLIIAEHSPDLIAAVHGGHRAALFEHCTALGFQAWLIAHDASLQRCTFEALERAGHCDVLFTRRSADQLR